MTKDQIIAELFFNFRIAKRLLEIDHPTCGCGKPSVGAHHTFDSNVKPAVAARCEEHWFEGKDPLRWAVRWDDWEEAEELDKAIKGSGGYITFGEQLRRLRRGRGLNQRDLAAQADIDFTYISKIENGQTPPPSEKTIQRLAQVLGDDEGTLIKLAGKIASCLTEAMQRNPLLSDLIHLLSVKPLSDETYRQLLQVVEMAEEVQATTS